jgi:putative ABC transport system permease protein
VRPGIKVFFTNEVVDFDFFQVYGLKPIAGRLFSRAHGADAAPIDTHAGSGAPAPHSEPVILNEMAVRKFGFSSPSAAVGQRVSVFADPGEAPPSEVIGVVPDFPFRSLRTPVNPTVFHIDPSRMSLLSVKVSAREQREALAAIDARWRTLDASRPIVRFPVAQTFHDLYADIEADGWVFSACSAIALLLACAGIYGLSAFIAERRTKEMGVRKALGAGRRDILWLLLWQLAKPVLWAQLLAWPVVFLALRHWLAGYAYHVELRPLMFLGAAATVLLIAWMTVLAQALQVARSKPVTALRYE